MGFPKSSNPPDFPMNIDAITIQRRTPSGSPPGFTLSPVFTGTADLQEGGGSTYITPAGAAEVSDAVLIIDEVAADGPLPTIENDDVVTNAADGKTFRVVQVSLMTFVFPFLEIQLKRGGLNYRTK